MNRFRLKNRKYISQLEAILPRRKTLDEKDALAFSGEEVLLIAKATGLRSKKVRKIVKRFRLVMNQLITDMVNEYKKV